MDFYTEPERKLPVKDFDVMVAGGGTGGVFAAIAAARRGAKTLLVESKGYVGGTAVEGGTALHSFYNLWKAYPGVEKRQLVKGIPDEFITRLMSQGGTPGHVEQILLPDYDSVCTAIDTETYKFVALDMLREAGVFVMLNTLVVDASRHGGSVYCALLESRSGREAIRAKMYIDATGYGDLSARAGARLTEMNDHPVANSYSVAGIDTAKYVKHLLDNDAMKEYALGEIDGKPDMPVRFAAMWDKISPELHGAAKELGMVPVFTTTHDNYVMFVKFNAKLEKNPVDRDAISDMEYELRRRMNEGIKVMRQYLPGFENAFIARTSPSLVIRRARCIECEYDISNDEIVEGVHFSDDVYSYGFHDCAPRIKIKDGRSYGFPFRAIQAKGVKNLMPIGMIVTSDWNAHMSTRNTVSCMAMGQAAGTAAAICAASGTADVRELPYGSLKKALVEDDVVFDSNPV